MTSARDDIDNPLPMPHDGHPFRGHTYVMHRGEGRLAETFREDCRIRVHAFRSQVHLLFVIKMTNNCHTATSDDAPRKARSGRAGLWVAIRAEVVSLPCIGFCRHT